MVSQFYANGKLLISGEYLVLYGARALVVPLKLGQHMKVMPETNGDRRLVKWQANVMNQSWFSAEIDTHSWNILSGSDQQIAEKIVVILRAAAGLNPALFNGTGYVITTGTDFSMEWGLGSSSALIANVARWATVDPFELLFRTTGGSGADVAAAISDGPVLYSLIKGKPYLCKVNFKPAFSENIWLVYSGKKQNTSQSVSEFNTGAKVTPKHIADIDEITLKMLETTDIDIFMQLIREHEKILSGLLMKPPVKETFFVDFPGEVKSLGAWGGRLCNGCIA